MRFWTRSDALPTVRFHQWFVNTAMACFTTIFHFQRPFIVLSVELSRKIVMTGNLPGPRKACVFDSGLFNGTLSVNLPGRAEKNHEILWSE
jgi:hypothetical protein